MQLRTDMIKKKERKKKTFSIVRQLERRPILITFNLTLDSFIINANLKNHHKTK